MGRGAGRDRRPPATGDRRARRRLGRLVHGQPGRVLLLPPAVGEGLPRRGRLPALVHGLIAGRQQPLRGQQLPLRLVVRRPDPGPRPHRPAGDRRRQPAGLPRQRDVRAAGQGPARRDRGARRPRRRRRPAPLRDRSGLRARRGHARLRRVAAPVAARGDLLRGPRRRGSDRAPGERDRAPASARRRQPSGGDRGPHRRPRRAGARARPRHRGRRARRDLRPHRIVPGAERDAGRVPARRTQPRHRQPRPRGRGDVRRPADQASTRSWSGSASARTARSDPGSATSPRCSAHCPRR